MSRDIDGTPDYRLLNRQSLYDAAATAVSKHCPHLTDGQKKRLALYIAEEDPSYANFRDERGWSCPPPEELKSQLVALEYLQRPDPEVYRVAPSVGELTNVLIAGQPNAKPTDKLNIQRAVADMDADARLEKSKGLDMTAAKAPAAPIQNAAGKKLAHEMTEAELAAVVREKFGPNLLPSKVKAHGDMMVAASRPRATPAIDEARSKIAAGRTWGQLGTIERMNAQREADVLGKTLRDLGLPV